VFENRVLRRIFGPRRDEVTGEWRKLHGFYYTSSTTTKSRMMDMACSTNGSEEKGMYDLDGTYRRKETSRKTKTYVAE
jgi:hypothetical protein